MKNRTPAKHSESTPASRRLLYNFILTWICANMSEGSCLADSEPGSAAVSPWVTAQSWARLTSPEQQSGSQTTAGLIYILDLESLVGYYMGECVASYFSCFLTCRVFTNTCADRPMNNDATAWTNRIIHKVVCVCISNEFLSGIQQTISMLRLFIYKTWSTSSVSVFLHFT